MTDEITVPMVPMVPLVPIPEYRCRDVAWTGFAYIVSDQDGKIVQATRTAEVMFDYSIGELCAGKTIEDLVPDSIRPSHPRLRKIYAANPTVRPVNGGKVVHGKKKGGEEFAVMVALCPFYENLKPYTMALIVKVGDPASTSSSSIIHD